MAKKLNKTTPEAANVFAGVLWLLHASGKDKLPLKDVARQLETDPDQLALLCEKDGLSDPLEGVARIEGDAVVLKCRRSDLMLARVTSSVSGLLAEDSDGARWEVRCWRVAPVDFLPGMVVLLKKAPGGEADFLAAAPTAERTLVCSVECERGWKVAVVDSRFPSTVVCLEEKIPAELKAGTLVEVTVFASAKYLPEAKGRIVRVMGSKDDAATQLEVALTRFELPHVFPEAVVSEAAALPDAPDEAEAAERIDLRDIPFMTIDGEDARDFDDAVWAKAEEKGGWRLLVAIADVSHYVTEGSALDTEAQKRATSVYFPSCVIPMLPEKLSNGLCSLNPDVDRCVMVCDMKISSEGETTAYQFYPGLIHSHARLTYTAAWHAINGDPEDLLRRGGSIEDVYVLYDLYKALRAARERRGAIDFETQETQVMTDETGLIKAIVRRDHNDAHRLIEECMLAANVCAADFIERRKAMSLFRVHEPPAPDRLAKLRGMLNAMNLKLGGGDKPSAADFDKVIEAAKSTPACDVVQTACLRTMQRALYTPDNAGHYGLGYSAYTHFTSPIRRYPDLLVHRTIRALLKRRRYQPSVAAGADEVLGQASGEKVTAVVRERKALRAAAPLSAVRQKQRDVWEKLGLIASACERRADEASRDVTAWLKCRFMEKADGRTYEATVTGVIGAGLFVTLDDPFVEGFVHVSRIGDDFYDFDEQTSSMKGRRDGKVYRLGTRLKVTVYEVNADMRRIDFEAAGAGRRGSSGGRRRGRFEEDADPWSWDWDEDPEDFDFEAFCGETPVKKKKKRKKSRSR